MGGWVKIDAYLLDQFSSWTTPKGGVWGWGGGGGMCWVVLELDNLWQVGFGVGE